MALIECVRCGRRFNSDVATQTPEGPLCPPCGEGWEAQRAVEKTEGREQLRAERDRQKAERRAERAAEKERRRTEKAKAEARVAAKFEARVAASFAQVARDLEKEDRAACELEERREEIYEEEKLRLSAKERAGTWGKARIAFYVCLGLFVVGLTFFFASFHVFFDVPAIIPKDRFTFADTFMTVEDWIERYNRASPLERISLKQSKVHRALEARGLIRSKEGSRESACFMCDGTGKADCPLCVNGRRRNPVTGREERCSYCGGRGTTTCTYCNGTGSR